MNPDPVREHLEIRTEQEIRWHIDFLGNTRQRLLSRPTSAVNPPLTPEQLDRAALKADRERNGYRLALMLIEAMGRRKRARREEKASRFETSWTAARKRPEHSGRTVQAR